jgi:hypothetical protein
MIALKWLLVIVGIGLFGSAGALVVYDVYVSAQLRRLLRRSSEGERGGSWERGIVGGAPFRTGALAARTPAGRTGGWKSLVRPEVARA